MSLLESLARVKIGVWQFWRMVFSANRDLPYNDYHHIDESSTTFIYQVGSDQITGKGDQKKHFVSKSTLIYSTVNISLQFNSLGNVIETILADTFYEFKHNIYQVNVAKLPNGDWDLYLYFEGVFPYEARPPE
jgi:hypothetical protein